MSGFWGALLGFALLGGALALALWAGRLKERDKQKTKLFQAAFRARMALRRLRDPDERRRLRKKFSR